MTKSELLAKSKELGVVIEGKPTSAELVRLIKEAEAMQDAPDAPVSDESTEEVAEPQEGLEVPADAEISVKARSACCFTPSGQKVRCYTDETHGPKYKELAESFAKKKGLTVR